MTRDEYIVCALLVAFIVVSVVLVLWIGDGLNLQYAWEAEPSVDVTGSVTLS